MEHVNGMQHWQDVLKLWCKTLMECVETMMQNTDGMCYWNTTLVEWVNEVQPWWSVLIKHNTYGMC